MSHPSFERMAYKKIVNTLNDFSGKKRMNPVKRENRITLTR